MSEMLSNEVINLRNQAVQLGLIEEVQEHPISLIAFASFDFLNRQIEGFYEWTFAPFSATSDQDMAFVLGAFYVARVTAVMLSALFSPNLVGAGTILYFAGQSLYPVHDSAVIKVAELAAKVLFEFSGILATFPFCFVLFFFRSISYLFRNIQCSGTSVSVLTGGLCLK